mmetsp:Transcript_629/g.1238  ORF Transcript_629/g.1238 Transcript_629/m.1238 type:complete len:408 (-) Transcript_629:3-1226(-)
MIPYNYRSYYPGRTELQNIGWAKMPPTSPIGTSHEDNHAPSPEQRPRQIQVNSTIEADIVLRRVIEDRAAILALKSRADENEAELMKAKTRQLHIMKILSRQEQGIARLTTNAKRELAEYNEMSKQYIRWFMFAFENGDIDKLPHHPFAPSLEELEQAIDRRKATLIEKVQADDRVRKLEFIDSQERVTVKVLKKNEEAFLRAIEISKQQFSDSCGTWLNRVNKLLSVMPHDEQKFGDVKKTMEVQTPEVQTPEDTFNHTPIKKNDYLVSQYEPYTRQMFTQDLELSQDKKIVSPQIPAKRPIGNFQPMCSDLFGDTEYGLRPRDESTGNKRQKAEHLPTPSSSTDVASRNEDYDMPHQESGANLKDNENTSTERSHICDDGANEEISCAQALTSLHGDNLFAVANI